jgi:hypothetical protein
MRSVQETSDGSAIQSKDARENSGDPISLSETSELASILHKKRATLAEKTQGNQEVADLNTAASLEYSVDSSESKENVAAPKNRSQRQQNVAKVVSSRDGHKKSRMTKFLTNRFWLARLGKTVTPTRRP